MFKAIGLMIILFGLSHFFTLSFSSLDKAMSQTFKTIEVAGVVSEEKLRSIE